MNDSLRPPCGQPSLYGTADLIAGAGRIAMRTSEMLDDENRPALRAVAVRLALHEAYVRLAADEPFPASLPPALQRDIEIAGIEPGASQQEILDEYVSCHLASCIGALEAVSAHVQSRSDPLSQQAGSAMFAAIHWLACARDEISRSHSRAA